MVSRIPLPATQVVDKKCWVKASLLAQRSSFTDVEEEDTGRRAFKDCRAGIGHSHLPVVNGRPCKWKISVLLIQSWSAT